LVNWFLVRAVPGGGKEKIMEEDKKNYRMQGIHPVI
jgi:hypothetical protein